MKKWILPITAALVPFLLLVAIILYVSLRPPADSVQPQRMAEMLTKGYISVETAEGYCELQGNEEFAELFCTENWEKISHSAEDPVLTLCFAEEYYLFLYEDGVVQAHDGYASPMRSGSVYYRTRIDCRTVMEYIAVYGEKENFRLRWTG